MDETVLLRYGLALDGVESYPPQRDSAWLLLNERAGRENGKRLRPEAAINKAEH